MGLGSLQLLQKQEADPAEQRVPSAGGHTLCSAQSLSAPLCLLRPNLLYASSA